MAFISNSLRVVVIISSNLCFVRKFNAVAKIGVDTFIVVASRRDTMIGHGLKLGIN